MRPPKNGLTLADYRVVDLGDTDDDFEALVEELDTGIPLAKCYRMDVAESLARLLQDAADANKTAVEKVMKDVLFPPHTT